MADALALLHALSASGLSGEDALRTLLGGTLGPAVNLEVLLGQVREPQEVLRLARGAALAMDDLRTACLALVARGIHPLSLLQGRDEAFHRWLGMDDGGWRFHLRCVPFQSECRWDQVTVRNFQPTPWLRSLPRSLQVLFSPEAGTLVLSDAVLTDVLHPDLELGAHLRLQACEGVIQLPRRIRGRLQLRFNEAAFRFPAAQDLDGILEILACPGVETLPETLRTTGLYLQSCPNLTTLPRRITGAVQIDLANVPSAHFPEEVEGLSYLRLIGMPYLTRLQLPSGSPLDVNLYSLPALSRLKLPRGGTLRDLQIGSCERLRSLPPELTTLTGSLTLTNLPRLTHLPEGLRVERDLRIANCPRLRGLPRGFQVGGEVNLEEAPHLMYLHI